MQRGGVSTPRQQRDRGQARGHHLHSCNKQSQSTTTDEYEGKTQVMGQRRDCNIEFTGWAGSIEDHQIEPAERYHHLLAAWMLDRHTLRVLSFFCVTEKMDVNVFCQYICTSFYYLLERLSAAPKHAGGHNGNAVKAFICMVFLHISKESLQFYSEHFFNRCREKNSFIYLDFS